MSVQGQAPDPLLVHSSPLLVHVAGQHRRTSKGFNLKNFLFEK